MLAHARVAARSASFADAGVFLSAALMIAVPGGGAWGLVLLAVLLAATPALPAWEREGRRQVVLALTISTVFIANFALNRWWHHAAWRELQNPLRWWLLPLLLTLLMRVRAPNPMAFASGAAFGTLGGAAVGLYQGLVLGLDRPGAFANQILYGDLALTLSATCGVAWLGFSRYRVLMFVGVAAGVLASLLSGARGGWIAVPVLAVVLAPLSRDERAKRWLWAATIVAIVASAIGWWLAMLGHVPRLQIAIADMRAYRAGDSNSSLGVRLEMWRSALELWRGSPWLGIGTSNFQHGLEGLVAAGRLPAHAAQYRHAHNEFLHAIATNGLIGLAALLLVSIVPLARFVRVARRFDTDETQRFYALCGVCVVVGFLIYGLTQAMFQHNLGILGFITLLAICWRGTVAARAA